MNYLNFSNVDVVVVDVQLRVFEAYSGKFQALLSNNQHSIRDIKENDVIIV